MYVAQRILLCKLQFCFAVFLLIPLHRTNEKSVLADGENNGNFGIVMLCNY